MPVLRKVNAARLIATRCAGSLLLTGSCSVISRFDTVSWLSRNNPCPSLRGHRNWGPFVGEASFYHLHYGDYLFAVNTTETQTFSLPIPTGQTKAVDLVSGKTLELNHELKVAPLTTVVLNFGEPKTTAK